MGWLHTTPDKKEVNRLEEFGVDSDICQVPSADTLIVTWFHEIGRCSMSDMTVKSVSFSEIESFSNLYQLNISPWEAEQLMAMSREYATMRTIAKDPKMRSPWNPDWFDERQFARNRVNEQFDKLLSSK